MFTNAQVMGTLQAIDARLARIEALAAGTPAVGAPVTPAASSPVVLAEPAQALSVPERDAKSLRFDCSKHADHKGGKGFTANGIAAHRAWCDGTVTQRA